MSGFQKKNISRGQVLGEKLRNIRLSKEISLADLHVLTNIPIKYLEILESGDYQRLPGDIYAKAWIKKYAQALGLDTKELLVDYKLEKNISEKVQRANKIFNSPTPTNHWHELLKPRTIKIIAIIILALAFLFYIGWEIKNIITPPSITILEPVNFYQTTENSVKIIGQTEPEVQLIINGEQVLLDNRGNFSQAINLAVGLNKLTINAKKKHSKISTVEFTIIRESTEQ